MTNPAAGAVEAFWAHVRSEIDGLPSACPEAWSFGATPQHADELLALVLTGTKTGTASPLWDFEASGEAVPAAGDLSIILDGSSSPRAVIETIAVRIVPFDDVDADHAFAEGEDDRTLASWRSTHEQYWRAYSENARGFQPTMPVVCERFRVVHPRNPVTVR